MNLDRDPYEGLGTPDRDPYEGLGTAVDPYEGLGSPEPSQNYFADKARRLGQAIPKAIGDTVASAGSAVQSGAELAAEALAWRAVRSGDLTEAKAAAKKKEFLDRAALTVPMQAAQAARDVGANLTAVGPRHFAKPDPARNEEIGSAVATGAASLVPLLAAGAAAPALAIPAAAGYMGESQRQDAEEKGATPTQQAAAFALGAPVGAASEALLGVPALLKSVRAAKPAVSKIERGLDAGLEKLLGKIAPAAVPVVQQSVKAALREGVQEGLLEQPAQNIIAKDIVGYDPTRDRSEGMGMAALAGSIVGGGVGAAAQLGQELDTRQNLAESKKTLLAQQQKLVRGLNAAQMFPVNAEGKVTNELPLPPEMARVATDRGVFHFNPKLIDEATLLKLSGAGRENTPLGLGSQSKADVAARVAQGDPAVAVTERTPDGTEVKAAVATVGTAAQTAAQLDASKTDGHTVQVESLGQVLTDRAKAAPNFIEAMLAADAAATTATREAAAKEDAARTERQKELAEKKARFEERLAVARQTLADPAASFRAVDGALTSLTSYAEDASLGLTQTQREQALKAQAALQKRHTQLAPAAAAQADTAAATRRAEAQLAADAKTAKVRAERAALQHLETTGRDLATGEITDLRNVPDEELATLDANAEGLTPQQIESEQARRGQAAERAAAQQNEAGYTLRDLILGKKPALAAAGQSSALRLKSPAALSLEGGTMAGEHRALGERQGGFKIFSDTGLAEDGLQERLQSLGFAAPDVTSAYALYERALSGEEIRPERGGENQVDFAERAGPRDTGVDANYPKKPQMPADARPGNASFQSYRAAWNNWRTAIETWVEAQPKNKALVWDERSYSGESGNVKALTPNIGDGANPWRITTFYRNREGTKLLPAGHQIYPSRAAALQEEGKSVMQFHASMPLPVMTEQEINSPALATTAPAPPAPRPILTDTQVAEQFAALRREFPALTRDLDLRSGLVADELKAAGYRGPVPPGVQAAILKLKAEKRLLVIATNAAREGNGGGLFLHEMAHPFFDALPPETQTILRELHAQEMATQTGPLFDAQGNLTTDVFVRAADFPPARLRADPDLPVKEWFAERVRALNAEWLAGRTPRDHSTLVRVWRELLAKLREIFAQVRGLDPDADLFTTTFRTWLNAGARADSSDAGLTHAGLAYATRQKAEFASYQDTMDLGSTPLGVTLPNEIRNLAPRWQDKTLQFESSLDKALYYAGGTPGELRTKIIDSLAEQTQLSPGEIATLARDLRQKLAPLARPTPSNGTVRVPAQMQSDAAKLTGTNFATGAAVPAWPENFPNVIVMTTVPNLYNQGGYEAAKAGNAEAARDVVLAAARENKFFDLQKRFPGAILVPVRALEKAGNNRLPGEFAHYFGHVTGLRVDEEIVQTNQTGHTGTGSDYRMAHRPTFDGAVIPGQTYIIVDDVVTMGGTLGELRAHLESHGGIVGAITTLAAAQFSAQIALTPKTKLALETQFNQRALSEWLKQQRIYGGTIGALTEAEGRWLLAAKTLDAAGNRLAAQRRQGDGSGVAPSVGAPAPTAGLSVDFASQASEYVSANGTPPAKVAAARADIEHLLAVVHDEQLELISYDAGGPVPRGLPAPVNVGDATRALRHRAAEALKAPTQPDVVRAAYGIDPRDPDYKGGERISSIIPALVADPKRAWDIRGAQIDTARDLMTLVSVLRSPYVETAKIILLNRDGAVVHSEIVAVGSLTAAIMDLTQLSGVLNRAPQTAEGYDVIFSHNHPGGNPQPGEADYLVTRRLRGLLDRTKHNLRDHIVTNGDTYFSYAENNWPVYQDKYARPSPPWAPTKTPSPVTAQLPAARGADADTHVQPGTQAPWEIVRRNELLSTATRETTQELIASLRQVDPTALHIIYLNRRNLVTALERVPNFKAAAPTKAGWQPWEPLTTKLLEGFGREAAASFMLVAPDTMTRREATQFMRDMSEMAEISGYTFIDFSAKQFTLDKTARSLGLMEPGVDFATGPDPKARLADVEQRLAALSESQEAPADLETRGRALTAERDQLKREIAAEARTDQAAKATIDVRHPAAVAIPSEPGDAWAMAPKMTDGEITAELDGIRNYIHAQGDGLAPAMRAHLAARLNALAAQQHARGTPLATVTPLPKIDRRAALLAELTRGRALAADGNRTGNDAALNEGNRLVKLATRALDEEFPGWDAAKPGGQKTEDRGQKTEDSRDQTPPPPAADGDGEQSPFSGAEEETMPVRTGKWSEVYGHSAYTPSFLLKTWRRIRAVLTGIRGPIPELPTFPAARWNKTDTFIAEHGPQFYARISEGERALKSANDYLQRTAQDQIGLIIEPLLKAEGKFNAEDYAQLRKYQEQARRTQAEGKPLPRSLTAGIAALNSQMESSPYVLFNRLVFALDLHWRATNLKDSAGNAITLPAGLNAAETKAEVSRLGTLLAASPHAALLQKAIEQHRALVKQVAEDLKSRELLAADHLANPYYFPHLTLEKQGPDNKIEQRELSPARVRPGTEADFRGYLETPVGSKKAIEQDYVRAMYYHLVQVGAHNFKADAVRDYFRPYDIKTTVERRAKELTKERGQPVTWEQAFNEEFAPRGYVKYGTDSRDAFPTLTINRDLLARRLGVMLTSGDLHAQLKALHQTGVKLLPEDIRESLTQGERETWIVPSRVAEALRGIGDRLSAQDNAVEAAAKWTLGVWKGWKLFMPMSHFRYEYGNVVADTEKLLSSSPGTFKYLPRAAKELRAFWQGGPPSADLQAALKEGVINAITAQEMDSLTRQKAFEAFETRSQKAWDMVKRRGSSILYQPATAALGLGDFSTPELSALREAITRYAHYQGNLEALRAGARPAYGGAYWKNIEAMTDSRPGANDAAVRKAAAISKATFGDYGDLSVLGQHARDQFIPFYSWMEINFRYHANLLRNLRDMVREGEGPAAAQAGKAVALAGASFTARTAGGIALRLALPYLALALWNASGDRDELEKLLSEEDRRRTHLILGRDAQGKVNVVYGNTALMDVMKWVSGPKFAQAMGGWLHGKTDFTTAAAAWRDAILPDLANNSVGSFGPYFKIPYTLASGKAVFPDVTDQRTVPAYDMRRNIIGQLTDEFTADLIERTVNKDYYGSKDLGGWAKQLIFQVRQRDPESWAFYAIKDKANDYLEKRTGTKRDSSVDAPDQQVLRNFRRAIYRGDADKAVQFYQRLLDYGYTAERFQASIRSQDPLSALPKENGLRKQFVESLSPDDRAQLDRAYVFYQRMNASRGQERQLFPSQSSGINGQMRYQAQPRTEALRAQMQRVDGMSDEEREQRAQRDERRSLQRTR